MGGGLLGWLSLPMKFPSGYHAMAQSWLGHAPTLSGLRLTARVGVGTAFCLMLTKLEGRIGQLRRKVVLLSTRVSIIVMPTNGVTFLFATEVLIGLMGGKKNEYCQTN
jgi:hypothetical protein